MLPCPLSRRRSGSTACNRTKRKQQKKTWANHKPAHAREAYVATQSFLAQEQSHIYPFFVVGFRLGGSRQFSQSRFLRPSFRSHFFAAIFCGQVFAIKSIHDQ
jgi:hypothetical protein